MVRYNSLAFVKPSIYGGVNVNGINLWQDFFSALECCDSTPQPFHHLIRVFVKFQWRTRNQYTLSSIGSASVVRCVIDQCHFNACNANFNIDSFSYYYYYHWSVCANNKVFYGLTRRAFINKSLRSNHRLNWRLQWKLATDQTINIRRKMIEHNQIFCFRRQMMAMARAKTENNAKILNYYLKIGRNRT